MGFAQLTLRELLRDITSCLNTKHTALHHLGFAQPIDRSTLADANDHRGWRLSQNLAATLMRKARPQYTGEDLGGDLGNVIYALDSTAIDLVLSLFPWADFRQTKAGV